MLLSESSRITPTHRRILALAFFGWMFDFYDLILYTFLTRPISVEFGASHMGHSVALGLSFAATAVGGILSGFLADRVGRRTLVSWTILLYSLGSLLSGLAPNWEFLRSRRMAMIDSRSAASWSEVLAASKPGLSFATSFKSFSLG